MLIILEGIDCSGKGWLAEHILKKGPQPTVYLKQGAKPKNKEVTERTKLEIAYSAMLKAYKNEFEPRGCHAIFDRFYPSELAYAETMRGYDPWAGNNFHILETAINSIEHALIYVQAPKELILERMEERGEDYITKDDIDGILIGYDTFMRKTSIKNVIRYNGLEDDPDDLIEQIFTPAEKGFGSFRQRGEGYSEF
jgi:thymidylate kinase